MSVFQRAGRLVRPENKGLSAKELRERNPALAAEWATFLDDNRAELVQAITGTLRKGDA